MEELIPDAPFLIMPMAMLGLIAFGSIWALIKGSDLLVDGAAGLAFRFGIPKIIVGATIVSLGTTSPECAVSVMAAWAGDSGLALGNAVGSIIADTGLIFGLGCALVVLPADRFVLMRQGLVKVCCDVLLVTVCLVTWRLQGDNAAIGRPIGILFLVLLAVYMWISVRWSKMHSASEPHSEPEIDEHVAATKEKPAFVLALMLLIGLAIVIFASRFLVASASQLAERWGVPQVVIASTLVAFGTSLPELTVGIAAILKGHRELLVGNVIGADILNVLFVVGASAVAAPLNIIDPTAKVPNLFLYLHLPTMMIMTGIFVFAIGQSVRRGEFRRWYGYPLLIAYAVFVVLQYVLSSGSHAAH